MGNTSITPFKFAVKNFSEYLNAQVELMEENPADKIFSEDTFKYFLQEGIQQNQEFQEFESEEQIQILGLLLYYYQSTDYDNHNSSSNFSLMHIYYDPNTYAKRLIRSKKDSQKFLVQLAQKYFARDGDQFYKWQDDIWEPSTQPILDLREVNHNLPETINTCGLTDPKVSEAQMWIESSLENIRNQLPSINNHLRQEVDSIEWKMGPMNQRSHLLPGRSKTIDLDQSSTRIPAKSDMFSVRLSFDPTSKIRSDVDFFMHAFPTKNDDLARMILELGCRKKPTLTILVGPSGSGKSTLIQFVNRMYGSFACMEGDEVDPIVRTCFMNSNDKLLDEDWIRSHPVTNIVFETTESPTINPEALYGGRQVNILTFDEDISPTYQIPDILHRMARQNKFGQCLGWCMKRVMLDESSQMLNMLQQLVN